MRFCQFSPLVLFHSSFHLFWPHDGVIASLVIARDLWVFMPVRLTLCDLGAPGCRGPWFPLRAVLLLSQVVVVWRCCFRFLFGCFCFSPYQSFWWCKSHYLPTVLAGSTFQCRLWFLVSVCFGLFGVCVCFLFGVVCSFGSVLRFFSLSALWWPHWTVYWSSNSTPFFVHLFTKMKNL